MSIWQIFKRWRSGSQQKKTKKENSSILSDLFQRELTTFDSQTESPAKDIRLDKRYPLWNKLSRREQDVTALTCLKYTNPQIAARLGLSRGTVRSYLEKALNKLALQNKADLRVYFVGWDFSEFERRSDPYR